MKADDAVAGLELGDALADFDDGAREFVAENLRRIHESMMNFFQIGAANAARGHSEEQFPFADLRDGHGLDDNLSLTAIHPCAHVRLSLVVGVRWRMRL